MGTTTITVTATDPVGGLSVDQLFTLVVDAAVPVTTMDTDTVYRLAATQPSAPTGGTGTEGHTPTDWQRTQPAATETEAVWRATRTRTYLDGVFSMATAWGNVLLVQARLLTVADFTVPDGRVADFVCLIEVDGSNNVYWASGGNGTILAGDLDLSVADIAFNRVNLLGTGLRLVRSGADSMRTSSLRALATRRPTSTSRPG